MHQQPARSLVLALFRLIQSWRLSTGLKQSLELESCLLIHPNKGENPPQVWMLETYSSPSRWQLLHCQTRPRSPVPLQEAWGPRGSPHDEVVPVHIGPIARAPQVARVPHHSTAPALLGVPEAVGVLAGDYLEQLLQHLIGVV